MAETLETLSHKIDVLTEYVVSLPTRLDELKSGLQTQIEAVDTKVSLVLEKVDHLIKRDIYHSVVHARFDQRLEDHELRLIALESPSAPSPRDDE